MSFNQANIALSPDGTRPPVPRPRSRNPRTNPSQTQGSVDSSRSTRPGVVVQAVERFKEGCNNKDMIRWLLGSRVGGQEYVRNVEVSQDRRRAFAEFIDPRGMYDM